MKNCDSNSGSCYHKMDISHARMMEVKDKINSLLTHLDREMKKDLMRSKIRGCINKCTGISQRYQFNYSVGDGVGISYYLSIIIFTHF